MTYLISVNSLILPTKESHRTYTFIIFFKSLCKIIKDRDGWDSKKLFIDFQLGGPGPPWKKIVGARPPWPPLQLRACTQKATPFSCDYLRNQIKSRLIMT